MRRFAVAAIIATALIVGGGVAFVLSTSTPNATASARTAYIAAQAQETAAYATLQAKLKGVSGLGNSAALALMVTALAPEAKALHTFEVDLEAIVWPASLQSDANAAAEAVNSFAAVEETASVQTVNSLSTWAAQLAAANGAATASVNTLRHALGLGPLA